MKKLDMRVENGRRVVEGWDRVFRALSAEPRRQLIVSLLDAPANQSVSLPESATNPNIPADPEQLRRELPHRHLPMLADSGFIEWETDPLIASRGPKFDEVAAVFNALHAAATDIPDSLVIGCQRLEQEEQENLRD
ncbi:hypothetical protein CV102_24275 [Natronococcus pandeyae]|uniref:ArsR family transcriptional regulator n=1 Tax=Natronococcus pandeyae TaxID=2055836 RepID=A0A8J8PYE4_9EURY|nr:hypothetical protein [Natronococcus pandeyae]TYL36091.1 hypothetical protein CV102_24275 [Natronococcus pandeyae]